MAKCCELIECETDFCHPVRIYKARYQDREQPVYIEIESLQRLKEIAEILKKPLLYNETHYIVIYDDIHYRTKKIGHVYQQYYI